MSVTLLIVDLRQYCVCCIKSGVFRCTLSMVLYIPVKNHRRGTADFFDVILLKRDIADTSPANRRHSLIRIQFHPPKVTPLTNSAKVTDQDSGTATLTPGDGTTGIKVDSSAYQIGLFSKMEKSSDVYRRNNNGLKTVPCGTLDTTLTSLLRQPSTITCYDRFERNCVNIDRTGLRYAQSRAYRECPDG